MEVAVGLSARACASRRVPGTDGTNRLWPHAPVVANTALGGGDPRNPERMLAGTVLDLPYQLPDPGAGLLLSALDVEGKITRALQALGPVAGRDVALVGPADGVLAGRLAAADARVEPVAFQDGRLPLEAGSADVVAAAWGCFRGVDATELAEADRVLRPGGRLLVLHDYGRDDISHLRDATLPEYTSWSRRDGPFLRGGFKIRVVHCFWTWSTLDDAKATLVCFGTPGEELAAALHRPRASWNVAVYHRWRGGEDPGDVVPGGVPLPVRDTRRLEGSVA
jgi:SAM-dependent methyltransferase